MEYLKVKSAAKVVIPKSPRLENLKRNTMAIIADVVGGTLGPGGHPVLIERSEHGLPPAITKDGVTVFRSLGFSDPVAHCIMESARDAAVRTAQEAGDGTTTATILAEAFTRLVAEYCDKHPASSPQVVIRAIQATCKNLDAHLRDLARHPRLDDDVGRNMLAGVARISANGDDALAAAVIECFDRTGDDGNVTIVESSGPSGVEVELIEGYPIPMGYEESCAKFYPAFITDPPTQRVVMDHPAFVLYFGRISDVQQIVPLMDRLQKGWEQGYVQPHNYVILATGFSEAVLASLATNFVGAGSINIFPLVVPPSPIHNSQRHLLDDLAAITGATVLDPITSPLEQAEFKHVGAIEETAVENGTTIWQRGQIRVFECSRYRSNVIGYHREDLVLQRVEQVRGMAANAESELDSRITQERLAKLTGGIARLRVIGASSGELRERRDRAEDAVCAVRGALRAGCLPGGGWAWHKLLSFLDPGNDVDSEIIAKALMAPVDRLLQNAGAIGCSAVSGDQVLDLRTLTYVDPYEVGLLDSTPAVTEALRNAVSIATVLGTLGGVVVQPRDHSVEQREARDALDFERTINSNPADERA